MDLNCMQTLTNIIIKNFERQKQKVKYWAMMMCTLFNIQMFDKSILYRERLKAKTLVAETTDAGREFHAFIERWAKKCLLISNLEIGIRNRKSWSRNDELLDGVKKRKHLYKINHFYIVIKYQVGDQATIFECLEFESIKAVRIWKGTHSW